MCNYLCIYVAAVSCQTLRRTTGRRPSNEKGRGSDSGPLVTPEVARGRSEPGHLLSSQAGGLGVHMARHDRAGSLLRSCWNNFLKEKCHEFFIIYAPGRPRTQNDVTVIHYMYCSRQTATLVSSYRSSFSLIKWVNSRRIFFVKRTQTLVLSQ